MSNSRKIKIFADAANLGSAKNIETNDLVNFRRGDSLEICVAFLENGKIRDMSGAVSATLEILDIGGFNAVNPRSVSLLMRAEVSEFSEIDSEASDFSSLENLHAAFNFTQQQTSIAAGEKWLRLFADFADGSRITFASGWIVVSENYSSEPNLLPIENPVYYTKADADETFLAAAQNLGDLPSAASARGNLGVYSKAETQALVNGAVAGSHTHSGYVEKSSNLADVADAASALQNLGGVSSAEFAAHKNLSDLQIAGLGEGQAALQNSASSLWLSKKPCASIEFLGGSLATKNISWTNGCYSFCFNLKIEEAPASAFGIIEVGESSDYNFMQIAAGEDGLELGVKLGSKTYREAFGYSAAGFAFGKFNSVVCVFDCNAKALKLFVGGDRIEIENNSSGEWGEWSDFSAQCVVGGGEKMSLASVKIFNADLSEFGGFYGVSDFLNGRRESDVLLRQIHRNTDPDLGATTSGGWSGSIGTKGVWTAGNYVSYIYNADLTGDSEAASLGISSAVDFTTKFYGAESSSAIGGFYNNVLNLNDFAGKTVSIHYSFYIKRMQNAYTHLGMFAPQNNAAYPAIPIAQYSADDLPYNQWVKIEDTVLFDVAYGVSSILNKIGLSSSKNNIDITAPIFRIANFKLEIAGAVASFDSRGNSNELRDLSLNENDAFASGEIKFEESANPAHCRESLSWAGTMATQEGSVEICKNSAVRIFAKSSAAATISASVNSVSKTAALSANVLAEIGEWIVGADANAEFSPSALLTGKIDIFYKIERL